MAQTDPRVTIVGLNYAPEPTGIAPYTAGLAVGLAARGWSVKAVTAFPHYPAWKISEGYEGRTIRETVEGVDLTRLRPYMPPNPSGVRRMALEVWFGIRSMFAAWGMPDVVILVSPALFAVAFALFKARLSRRRPAVIVWVQDLYSLGVTETGALGGAGARVMTGIESRVLRGADAVVAIHDRFKRYMVSKLDVQEDRVEVVRNWTHLKPFVIDRAAYRKKFKWGDEIVVLHAGNMGAKQALENVVEAARLADNSESAVKFVLLGNGNRREALMRHAQGVVRLEFMDSLGDEDFQGAMAAADILLVNEKPGVTEMAVPSKLTSYFAASRPVIVATDAGSITAEEIERAEAGVRVNAGDPQALLDASLSLGRDAGSADTFGANGARFQRQVLSSDAAVSHYAEIINSLAGKRGL
ncbi:glycosyltransferase involved in cell wall biosynthesis [Glaciihabitans tibetensis]|uniref:Glycosyltransferase involved in cell wall biosynthesis n=1 Tax=Glaciihabitans tibetensis TaxID=1266600 RepID=A0A2T0V393_9MICO|nr:glycosyltransferase [Glaciihabitans tibetensis]PRY64656.1 glycosyltransferase involved in cell wall biosynthesis [Glaciihabitans tibetensis]